MLSFQNIVTANRYSGFCNRKLQPLNYHVSDTKGLAPSLDNRRSKLWCNIHHHCPGSHVHITNWHP